MIVGREEMLFKGTSLQYFLIPYLATILKWLRFKVVSWRHDFQPYAAMIWDCLIVGLLWFHHIQSLADVTMATTTCNLL
jgi:hypothetical protein